MHVPANNLWTDGKTLPVLGYQHRQYAAGSRLLAVIGIQCVWILAYERHRYKGFLMMVRIPKTSAVGFYHAIHTNARSCGSFDENIFTILLLALCRLRPAFVCCYKPIGIAKRLLGAALVQ